LLATYARQNDRPLIFHLRESPSSADDIVTITVDAATIKDNTYHQFSFSPLPDSRDRSYYFFLESPQSVPGNAITIWHSPYDAYEEGELYIDGRRQDGDLAFRTYYGYSLKAMATDAWHGIANNIPLILLATALFLLPGYALSVLFLPKSKFDIAQRLIVSTGLSIAFYPLFLLFCTLVGFKVNAFKSAVVLVIFSGIAMYSLVKESAKRLHRQAEVSLKTFAIGIDHIYPLLIFIFVLSLGVRLFIVRDLPVAMWTDSYHHTLISQLIAERGYIPDSYEPYAHLHSFTYHFGFHALVAFFHWLTGISVPRSVILVGQILNALSPLTAYLLAAKLLESRRAGLFSALIVGLLANMPAYYVNWGRYTQLAGQVVLPVVLITALESLESEERSLRYLAITGIALAGLLLIHYRIFIFYTCFMLVYLLYQALASETKRKFIEPASRMFLIGLLATLLTLPWLWNVFTDFVPRHLQVYNSAGDEDLFSDPLVRQYFGFSMKLVSLSFNSYLIALSLLGCIWGMFKREKSVILIVLWLVALFIVANLYLSRLPLSGLMDNGAVIIGLYLPGSILSSYSLDRLAEASFPKMRFKRWAALEKVIVALSVVLAALLGARRMLDIIEPSFALVSKSDMLAMDWIRRNTPKEAKFFSNSSLYLPDAIIGSDAGLWIPLLAGREATVPPMMYNTDGSPEYIAAVNALAKGIAALSDAEEMLPLFKSYGVTHIYIGKRGGDIKPQKFINSPYYQLLYNHDGVWIFEIKYDAKSGG